MSKKNKKAKQSVDNGTQYIEVQHSDIRSINLMGKEVEGKGVGTWRCKTDIGEIDITIKETASGQLRKTFRYPGKSTNVSVLLMKKAFRELEAKPEKEAKSKKHKKQEKETKPEKKETSKDDFTIPEIEKIKVKKAKKALSSVESISKKKQKAIVKMWGDAKKISATTLARTIDSVIHLESSDLETIFQAVK